MWILPGPKRAKKLNSGVYTAVYRQKVIESGVQFGLNKINAK